VTASSNGQERIAMPPTGVAVIGCGYWGRNYLRLLEELPDAHLAAICDQDEAELRDLSRRFPHALATTDIEEALSAPGVEAAIIATPATTHGGVALRALEHGRHVLVEKPLATDATTASEVVAAAASGGQVLLVGHTFLYNTAVRKVKEYVDHDNVYYMYAQRTNLGPIRGDVNAIWDLAPHDVSIFNYLMDAEPEWVSAVGARVLRNHREDVGFITLGYPDGVIGHIHVSWADPNKVREVVVVLSERRVVFNDVDPLERVRVFHKGVESVPVDPREGYGEAQLRLRDGDIVSPAVDAIEPLRFECGHFLHCIRRGEKPFTSGAQGVATVRVMEAIDLSIMASGARVQVARDDSVLVACDSPTGRADSDAENGDRRYRRAGDVSSGVRVRVLSSEE
jgi:predicted dehydrogenase